jgi:DNA-binding GntR family transcriptional regulator
MVTRNNPKQTSQSANTQTSASDIVFHGIVRGLEIHRFVPGQRLVEADLAAQFNVGRNSVREGLQRLAADGVIEIVRHKGAVVRSLSPRETLDVLDVAERMTGLLARTAARAVTEGSSVEMLTRAMARLQQAHQSTNSDDFAQARRHFYRVLLDLGGSLELRRLFRVIHMPIVHAQNRLGSLQALRLSDYHLIGEAVIRGNEAAADKAGRTHVCNVRAEILKKSSNHGLEDPTTDNPVLVQTVEDQIHTEHARCT